MAIDFKKEAEQKNKISRVEREVSAIIMVWVVAVTWLIGGRPWWAQALGVVAGGAALAVALSVKDNGRSLVRFPIFWLGLAFFAYLLCQALNPGFVATLVAPGARVWDVKYLSGIPFFPTGVAADYFTMNTWRVIVYWLGPWLLACAWWSSVRKRRTGWRLIWVVWANGMAVALLVIAQSFHPPANAVLGIYSEPGVTLENVSSGPFIYRNATGMFLYLALVAGLSSAARLQSHARNEGKDSGLSWAVLVGSAIIVASFFILGSRADFVIGLVIYLGALVLIVLAAMYGHGGSPKLLLPWLVLLLALAGCAGAFLLGKGMWTVERWIYVDEHPQEDARAILREATEKMIADKPVFGHGAGSYRYVSPSYFLKMNAFTDAGRLGGLKYTVNQAHSDWLQFPMEYGAVGAGVLLAMLLYWYGMALRYARWLYLSGGLIILGTLTLLAHAAIDFPFYDTTVLTVFTLFFASTIKSAILEKRRAG